MDDLPAFSQKVKGETKRLLALGLEAPRFSFVLDQDFEPDAASVVEDHALLAMEAPPKRIPLDELVVEPGTYAERLKAQANLPGALRDALLAAYA
jgi:hypothetical protein